MARQPSQDDKKNDHFEPKSSFISSADYDEKAETMTLTFKSGSQYRYVSVGKTTWLSFKQSPDHSSFYSKAIKGNLASVPIVKKDVGQPKSTPLKKLKIERRPNPDGNSILKRSAAHRLRRAGLTGPGTVPNILYS